MVKLRSSGSIDGRQKKMEDSLQKVYSNKHKSEN